ncbi:hypothetical protein QO010_003899 [Caulobacter ginsengisoli]|uniref:DUF2147 domain-containing protein n=1 Tax=Caulobacter ginsengisoli TaxID=400775 RepID=A0ABU0IVR2_9CAUL|nr:hypothetical protein [Caulobacter ginsengisoli]MDQ0466106.1 hypothetical protein [Caulobacter ginsengisoli]
MRVEAILTCLIVLTFPLPAAAEPPEGVAGRWSASIKACNSGNSETVPLAKVAARPEGYIGRCLAIVGAWDGIRFCTDRSAMTGPVRATARCIGAESRSDEVHQRDKVEWVRLYGELSLCADFWAMAATTDELWRIGGFCHTSDGPDLRVTARQPLINPGW